jgi:hypothetical protein
MVTLRTCSDLAEAEVLKSLLEGSGVTAFLPDEDSVLWENALGGIRLQVAEEDVDRANDVIQQAGKGDPQPPAGAV